MKTFSRIFFAVALLPLASCNQKTVEQPAPDPQEVERQVQQRLAEEHRAEQDQKLQQKEQTLAEREKALADREREAANKPAPIASNEDAAADSGSSYELFYNDLDNDGDWIQTDRYGYVWQPSVETRDSGWRPYTDGHWAYTADGWTWVSNERFGWATYHYGRWARVAGMGWVWVPGSEWAPAWVSWRHGDDYVGWAPLPPEARFHHGHGFGESVESEFGIGAANYLFVAVANFCAPHLREVVVAPSQNVTIINSTRNITNISYNNKTIVNTGPRVEVIAARATHPVQRLTIVKNSGGKPGPAAVNGNQLVVSAPVLKKSAVPATPARVAKRVTGVQPEHLQKPAAASQSAAPAVVQPKHEATPAKVVAQPQPDAAEKSREMAEQQQKKAAEEAQRMQAEAQAKKAQAEREAATSHAAVEKKMSEEKSAKPQEAPGKVPAPAPAKAVATPHATVEKKANDEKAPKPHEEAGKVPASAPPKVAATPVKAKGKGKEDEDKKPPQP